MGEETGKAMCCGSLNPRWVETLMGVPLHWTDADASQQTVLTNYEHWVMASSRLLRQLHGKCSPKGS